MAILNITNNQGKIIELTIDDTMLTIDNTFFHISEDFVKELDYNNNI